jgi:hypothetical protein
VSAGDDSGREEAIDADNMEFMNLDNVPHSEVVQARQHTTLWNEDHCLNIAPGQHSHPLNIIYDLHAEELSFSGHILWCRETIQAEYHSHSVYDVYL